VTVSGKHNRSEECQCPICRAKDFSAPFWETPKFHRCSRCGLIFRVPFPDTSSLDDLYKMSWVSPDVHKSETGATDLVIASAVTRHLLRSMRESNFSGKRILDFGAGRGSMALSLKQNGADVVAVERYGTDYLSNLGLATYSDLSELPLDLYFDGVVSLEVIEHLPAPAEILAKLYQRLKAGGWLFVTTPNPTGLPAKLAGEHWREAARPGHILFFPAATLQALLEKTGFCNIQRLRWLFRYPDASIVRTASHYLLQSARLDGGLRLLAYKNTSRVGAGVTG
jgi:SAM-dependent methyltransferase